jgi:hypothetical protein
MNARLPIKELYLLCKERYKLAITSFIQLEAKDHPIATRLDEQEARFLIWAIDLNVSSGDLDCFEDKFSYLSTEVFDCLSEIYILLGTFRESLPAKTQDPVPNVKSLTQETSRSSDERHKDVATSSRRLEIRSSMTTPDDYETDNTAFQSDSPDPLSIELLWDRFSQKTEFRAEDYEVMALGEATAIDEAMVLDDQFSNPGLVIPPSPQSPSSSDERREVISENNSDRQVEKTVNIERQLIVCLNSLVFI